MYSDPHSVLEEAFDTFKSLLSSLQEAVFDLVDPVDFKRGQELYGKLEEIPSFLKDYYVKQPSRAVKALGLARVWLTELEKLFSGQMSLFAATSFQPGTKVAVLESKDKATFTKLHDLLDAMEVAMDEVGRPSPFSGIKPSSPRAPSTGPRQKRPVAPKTFVQAQKDIMDAFKRLGWSVSGPLKVPYVTEPSGKIRLWFKPQAVYFSQGKELTQMGKAMSLYNLFPDIRMISPDDFVRTIYSRFKLLVDRSPGVP